MHGKTIALLVIGTVTAAAALLLSQTDSNYEASFGTTIDFLSGIVRDVDHVGLTLTRVSAENEMEVGREINDRIESESSFRLADSSEYEVYIEDVGNILLEHVKRKEIEYHFQVVYSEQINAFAIAGGYIYVTTGMLEFLESEAELAGVLAHEISHIDLKHCIERLQYELALRKLIGKDLAAIARIGYMLVELGFSEQRELEADINGIQMAAKAGYNPSAILHAFNRLKSREVANQTGRDKPTLMVEEIGGAVWKALEQYFASHPTFRDRIHHDALVYERNKDVWNSEWFYDGKINYEKRTSKKRSFFMHELTPYSREEFLQGNADQLKGDVVSQEGEDITDEVKDVKIVEVDKVEVDMDDFWLAGISGVVFVDYLADGTRGPEMVVVPSGHYRMGHVSGMGSPDERPVHKVIISYPFAMGKYEVTLVEYEKFARATGRAMPEGNRGQESLMPVVGVTWDDATAYTDWLSEQTGKRYRLPSEAEWEYAARAGTVTKYWWGNELGKDNAACRLCSGRSIYTEQLAVVGSFRPNPFGIHDTVGNVWEWTEDCWHDSYYTAPQDGSPWLSKDCYERSMRGGFSFGSSYRGWNPQGESLATLGFRLARNL